jgi:outer membrane biosynthesis protein TonB
MKDLTIYPPLKMMGRPSKGEKKMDKPKATATLAEAGASINGKSTLSPVTPDRRKKEDQGKPKPKAQESKAQESSPKAQAPKDKDNGKKTGKKAPRASKTDQFGLREGGKCSLFAKMIVDARKTGTTMEQVKKAPWNKNHAAYPGTLLKLKKAGRVKVTDGKIVFVR